MVSASLLTQESMWLRPHYPVATLCKTLVSTFPMEEEESGKSHTCLSLLSPELIHIALVHIV